MTDDIKLGNFRFCPLCSAKLVVRAESLRERLTCPACGYIYYHNPVPAAGGVILRDGRVCLVRRSIEPRKGDWTLPAGFVEYDESAEQCAVREVAEETGLAIEIAAVHGVYAGFDDPRQRVVLVLYRTRETETRTPIAGDDADDVGFFAPDHLPPNIAFRAHRQALRDLFAHERVSP